jgi:hypothetical protein
MTSCQFFESGSRNAVMQLCKTLRQAVSNGGIWNVCSNIKRLAHYLCFATEIWPDDDTLMPKHVANKVQITLVPTANM